MEIIPIWGFVLFAFGGLALHALSKWQGFRDEVPSASFSFYLSSHPIRVTTAVIGALLGFTWCYIEGAFSGPSTSIGLAVAFSCGYMPNSIVDNVVKRANLDQK